VGSAQSVTTFEIRPTLMGLPADQGPDELMIDWNNVPPDTAAQIYLPAVNADTVLTMADRMYTSHRLTRVDGHTPSNELFALIGESEPFTLLNNSLTYRLHGRVNSTGRVRRAFDNA
jgi:hypothetical protein